MGQQVRWKQALAKMAFAPVLAMVWKVLEVQYFGAIEVLCDGPFLKKNGT
jgi:hypothetical protein